jgi:aryl-alcohol dehydrogenase-like predicted oxidoreductase
VIPQISLAPDYSISRLIKGGWHLAGGHGAVDADAACRDMAAFVDAGITAFDCADIYTGVEELIGRFRRQYPAHAKRLRVHTKFVPDLDSLTTVDREYTRGIVERSLQRLGLERLDLVQFHWWDYRIPRYVEIALELEKLRQQGKIDRIGVTNFAVAPLEQIVAAGVPVLAHQLQYSLLDRRPAAAMTPFCAQHGITMLCYGTVAGGFLSERWLGAAAPLEPLANRSLIKYRLIIDEFGGWDAFQSLLRVLQQIASKHRVDIGTVATRWVMDRPCVGAAIVGATNTAHLAAHTAVGNLRLDGTDLASIDSVLNEHPGPSGDVYDLERDRDGPHGRIMRYSLNRPGQPA